MKDNQIIITCEHGGNKLPQKFKKLFSNHSEILNSHRGWDIGALDAAKKISAKIKAPIFFSEVSRLLIEANRSLNSHELFSEFSNALDTEEKQKITEKYYSNYRNEVEECINNYISKKKSVVHISIHSFTPVLNDQVRYADIGLLYDSSRKNEKLYCHQLENFLNEIMPELIIKHNYPYLGTDDGFTTFLRKKFTDENYLGIEIEINQKLVSHPYWKNIISTLAEGLVLMKKSKNIMPKKEIKTLKV